MSDDNDYDDHGHDVKDGGTWPNHPSSSSGSSSSGNRGTSGDSHFEAVGRVLEVFPVSLG